MNREARYRKNRRAKGSTQIAVWLSAEDQERLNYFMGQTDQSKSDAIRNAIHLAARSAWNYEQTLAESGLK